MLTIACVLAGCGTHGKLGTLTRTAPSVTLGLPYDDVSAAWGNSGMEKDTTEVRDTPEEYRVISVSDWIEDDDSLVGRLGY